MAIKLSRYQTVPTVVLGMTMLLWLPGLAQAQSGSAPPDAQQSQQDRMSTDRPSDDVTRRDLARFDQFLDTHREDAEQLRHTPSLIDDPQYLKMHPELNGYLQDHPSVRQEISQQPDTFMRLEDQYNRDRDVRDRDARLGDDRGPDANRDADRDRRGADPDRGPGARDDNRGPDNRRDVAEFNRFLDDHRETAEQLRKDPSLADNRQFIDSHPALRDYYRDHPGVREQLRQDPNAFMHEEDRYQHDAGNRDPRPGDPSRPDPNPRPDDRDRRELANFNRFLDDHRETAEQLRKDPSLADNRQFVMNHPALDNYLRDNPGVRDQLQQNPNRFMREEDRFDHDANPNGGGSDAMQDHMADFGGFLGAHDDIRNDLARDPNNARSRDYPVNHTELNSYLDSHPGVRDDLNSDPQGFVKGAQKFSNGSGSGSGSGNGSGANNGSGTQSAPPPSSTPKPKQ